MKIQEKITSLDDDIDSLMITANVLLKIHTASIIKLVLADKNTEPNLQYQLEITISKGKLQLSLKFHTIESLSWRAGREKNLNETDNLQCVY